MKQTLLFHLVPLLLVLVSGQLYGQQDPFTLSVAVKTGLGNYQGIAAKRHYLQASAALVENTKNQYLPDVTASIQQAYGTINGQFGPSGIIGGGTGLSSSGPVSSAQSWNAAFGSVYLVNTNWEFISFGRLRSRIATAGRQLQLDSASLTQEKFVQGIKIAGAYLNLLISQRFVSNASANVQRASQVRQAVMARTRSGLNAGVDSSIANADLSAARVTLIQAVGNEEQQRNLLCQLINIPPAVLSLDTTYFSEVPREVQTAFPVSDNPQVQFYRSRVNLSASAEASLRKSIYPGLNLFGSFQAKASGFGWDYTPLAPGNYSKSYFDGLGPSRYNYVAGLGIAWNILSPSKIRQQVRAQQFITEAYRSEYDLVSTQLADQLLLSDQQIENSLQSIREVPVEYKAAMDAYVQKSVLYKNGLANIVDVQQALYNLNRAETDRSVAYINVWQALLLKAAASGDFDLFLKQVK